ncbi:hypothetical protein LCGC14_0724340 [marine sediment metagenome]|uniref:Uncharacterized protein n=1 Tax=marine sediment metagenome TaxID=412755 RepID=A0A0F9QWH2_9ZZZZ
MALGAAERVVDNDTDLDAANLNQLDDGLNIFHSPTGGLNFRVTAGHVWLKGVGAPDLFSFAEVTVDQVLSPNVTTLVFLDQAGALTTSNTLTAFPSSSVPLAVVTTNGSTVEAVANRRARIEMPGSVDWRLWRTGRFYTNRIQIPTTVVTLTADTLYGIPFPIYADTPIDRLAVEVTTAQGASQIRLGLYAESTTVRGEPGALLEDLGVISTVATGMKALAVSPTRRLGPGRYFLGLISSDAGVAFRAHLNNNSSEVGWAGSTLDLTATNLPTAWRGALGGNDDAAALPDPFPATPAVDLITAAPAPVFRAA